MRCPLLLQGYLEQIDFGSTEGIYKMKGMMLLCPIWGTGDASKGGFMKKRIRRLSNLMLVMALSMSACLSGCTKDDIPKETPGGEKESTTEADTEAKTEKPTEETITEEATTEEETTEETTEDPKDHPMRKEAAEYILDIFENGLAEYQCMVRYGLEYTECKTYVIITDGIYHVEGDYGATVVTVPGTGERCLVQRLSMRDKMGEWDVSIGGNLEEKEVDPQTGYHDVEEKAQASRIYSICDHVTDYINLDTSVDYYGKTVRVRGLVYWLEDGTYSFYIPRNSQGILSPVDVDEEGNILLRYLSIYNNESEERAVFDPDTMTLLYPEAGAEKPLPEGLTFLEGGWPVYDKLMFPKAAGASVLGRWVLDGAEEKDGIWYKKYWREFIAREAITLYAERSMDSEKTVIEVFTPMYAVATDRENWIYMESKDGTVCGWLPIEWNEEQKRYAIQEEFDSIYNLFCSAFTNTVTESTFMGSKGTLSLDSPLLEGLDVGEVRRIPIPDLKQYIEDNQEMLQAQPELLYCLKWQLIYDSLYGETVGAYLIAYKDAYKAPTHHEASDCYVEDRQAMVIEMWYGMDAVREESGYFQVQSFYQDIDEMLERYEQYEFVFSSCIVDYDYSDFPEMIW